MSNSSMPCATSVSTACVSSTTHPSPFHPRASGKPSGCAGNTAAVTSRVGFWFSWNTDWSVVKVSSHTNSPP